MPTLQGLFIQPRKGLDPRIAQTDSSKRSIGADGKLYKLVPKNDVQKYRIMNDKELSLEQRRTQEIAINILEKMSAEQRRKHMSATNNNRNSRTRIGTSLNVPDFAAIKKKKQTEDLSTSKENITNAHILKRDQVQNERVIGLLHKEKVELTKEISTLKNRLSQKGLSQSVDDIHLRSDSTPVPARSPASRRSKSASYRDVEGRVRREKSSVPETPTNLSVELQADIDKYIRKRREIEEQEARARREQAQYEEDLKRRSLNASLRGHEFSGLMQRDKELHAIKVAKEEKKKKETEAVLLKEKRLWEQQKREHLEKPLPSNSMSWKQIEEAEELKRKQRVEERKQNLLSMTAPFRASEPAPSKRRTSHPGDGAAVVEEKYVFKARDPQEVISRLSQQQEDWEQHIRAMRSKRKKGDATTVEHKPPAKSSLELRAIEYAQKSKARKEARLARQKAAEEKRKLNEEEKRQKLLNTRVPESSKRLTKSVEYKIKKVRESREHDMQAERRQEAQLKKKERALSEAAAVVKTIVEEREMERKQQHGGFIELKQADQRAAEKAIAAKSAYREQLRANRRRIHEALKSRPSLIERHEQQVTKRDASAAALKKVATAIFASKGGLHHTEEDGSTSRGGGGRGGADDYDDLFDEEEKAKLRYDNSDDE